MPMLVGALCMLILPLLLAKAGHAANDLCVIDKPPQSRMGKIQWGLTKHLTVSFSFYCNFIQSFQLQASKLKYQKEVAWGMRLSIPQVGYAQNRSLSIFMLE